MPDERLLQQRLVVAGATEAKAQIDTVRASLGELVAAQMSEGEAVANAATAEELQAAAAQKMAEQAALNRENFSALDQMIGQLRIQLTDLAEVMADDDADLETMQGAVARTVVQFAGLREAVAALQEAGQPVPASVLTALDAASEKVAAYREQLAGLAEAEGAAGEAAVVAGEKMTIGGVGIDKAAVSGRGLKLAMLGISESMGGVIGAVAPWLLLMTLLPTVLEQVGTGFSKLTALIGAGRDKLADWIEGVGEAIDVERKKNETDEQYAERVRLITDLTQKEAEAQTAMNAGVIPLTDNVKLATIAWIAHQAAIFRTPQLYDLLRAAMKEAGLKMVETFDEVKAKGAALEAGLQAALAIGGVKAAATWAEASRGLVKEVIQGYDDFGQKVPADIKAVADSLDIHSRAQTQALKLQKEYNAELQKASDEYTKDIPKIKELAADVEKNAEAYVKATAAIETHRRESNAAIADTTKKTVDGLFDQIAALDSLGLTQEQKNKAENELLGEITVARTKALNEELANNAKAKDDQNDLDKKEAEQLIKFQERAAKMGLSLSTLGAANDALKSEHVVPLTDAIEEQLRQHGLNAAAAVAAGDRLVKEASPKVTTLALAHERVNAALRSMPDAAQTATGGFDTLDARIDGTMRKVAALAGAINKLSGAGGIPGLGGGAPLEGGQIPGSGGGEAAPAAPAAPADTGGDAVLPPLGT